MGIIVYNGLSSWDFHILVEHPPGYETPEKDYEVVHVPGRNGDLFIDKGSYQNVTRKYEIAFGSYKPEYTQMANRVSEWLHSASGYVRLEDTYEPDYYRLAVFQEAVEFENLFHRAGRATISFNCKPQRFLKSGERSVSVRSGQVLMNPTRFPSLPTITVRGSGAGTITVNDDTVSISEIGTLITIDSEMQDAYSGLTNRNSVITLSNKEFPQLRPGENTIRFSGGVTSVEVTPKWWTL